MTHEKMGLLPMQKTKAQISRAVTAQLISAFVFTTRIVHFLPYLYPKFQDSSFLLGKPEDWFSHVAAHLMRNVRT